MSAVPEHVTRLREVMASYPGDWALCGGWAVDAALGKETREHSDVDFIVFRDDIERVRTHFASWELVAHPRADGDDNGKWHGEALVHPAHIHAPAEFAQEEDGSVYSLDDFTLDIQVCERRNSDWILTRDPNIAFPLDAATVESMWGLPTVVPEVLLFYKAIDRRRRDQRDFEALLPLLTEDQRAWLNEAIGKLRHPWLDLLAPEAGKS